MNLINSMRGKLQQTYFELTNEDALHSPEEELQKFYIFISTFINERPETEFAKDKGTYMTFIAKIKSFTVEHPPNYIRIATLKEILTIAGSYALSKVDKAFRDEAWLNTIHIITAIFRLKGTDDFNLHLKKKCYIVVKQYFRPDHSKLNTVLILSLLEILFSECINFSPEEVSSWWTILWDLIFPLYYLFPVTQKNTTEEKILVQSKHREWNREDIPLVTNSIMKFLETYNEKENNFIPFLLSETNTLYGVVKMLSMVDTSSLDKFLRRYFPSKLTPIDDTFAQEYETNPCLPSAFNCIFDSTGLIIMDKILSSLIQNYSQHFVVLFCKVVPALMQEGDMARACEALLRAREAWRRMLQFDSSEGSLSTLVCEISQSAPPLETIMRFMFLYDARTTNTMLWELLWMERKPNENAQKDFATLFASAFFPVIFAMDFEKFEEFCKNYEFRTSKNRDPLWLPNFIQEISILPNNGTIFAVKSGLFDPMLTSLYLQVSFSDWKSENLLDFIDCIIKVMIKKGGSGFLTTFAETIAEIRKNIPVQFAIDNKFIDQFIMKITTNKDLDSGSLSLFNAGFGAAPEAQERLHTILKRNLKSHDPSQSLKYISENIRQIDTELGQHCDMILEKLETLSCKALTQENCISYSNILTSLYEVLDDNQMKVKIVRCFNTLMENNSDFCLIGQIVTMLIVASLNKEASDEIKCETICSHFEKATPKQLSFYHAFLSETFQRPEYYSRFMEPTLHEFCRIAKLPKKKTEHIESYASLCVDIILCNEQESEKFIEIFNSEFPIGAIKNCALDTIFATLSPCSLEQDIEEPTSPTFLCSADRLDVVSKSGETIKVLAKGPQIIRNFRVDFIKAKTLQQDPVSFLGKRPTIKQPATGVKTGPNNQSVLSLLKGKLPSECLQSTVSFYNYQFGSAPDNLPQAPELIGGTQTEVLPPDCSGAIFGELRGTERQPLSVKTPTKAVHRAARAPLSLPMRTQSKIGVLFVPHGVFGQNDLLRVSLDETSEGFRAFLRALGRTVSLKTHTGFDGKLDTKRLTNGAFAVSFADRRFDTLYHVAPMMPTVSGDPQQILKKRHIGNDNVHVVWVDDPRERYNAATVVSQFNDAHVIVSPLSPRLMSVHTRRKDARYEVGPVFGEVVVGARVAGILAAWTAVLSDVSVRDLGTPLGTPHRRLAEHMRTLSNTV